MFLTGVDVFGRYVFNRPIMGSSDITNILMAMVVSFGFGYCALKKGHVRVDLVLGHLPFRARKVLDAVAYLASFGFYCVLIWQVTLYGRSLMESKMSPTSVLAIPIYPFIFLFVIGAIILALVFLRDTVQSIYEVTKK